MTLVANPTEARIVCDQARELRRLMAARSSAKPRLSQFARSLAIVSGKGGVGNSIIALNLGAILAQSGASVGLLDATPGSGSLALLSGQNGYWNLSHVSAGVRTLDEIVLPGPGGSQIISGGRHLLEFGSRGESIPTLMDYERHRDWLIVDAGTINFCGCKVAAAADLTIVVTTPEPTSVAETYAVIKSLSASGQAVSVLVNQAESGAQADQILDRLRQAARAFVGSDIARAGHVPFDVAVVDSVFRRSPLSVSAPGCPANEALRQVGERLTTMAPSDRTSGFAQRLQQQTAPVEGECNLRKSRSGDRDWNKSVRLNDPGEIN